MAVNQATYNKRLLEVLEVLIKQLPQSTVTKMLLAELVELKTDVWKMNWEQK